MLIGTRFDSQSHVHVQLMLHASPLGKLTLMLHTLEDFKPGLRTIGGALHRI